ncbi:MAG: efflux RND transporter periplasmic adaptor subunit [Gammaproteobacteria bacterium]
MNQINKILELIKNYKKTSSVVGLILLIIFFSSGKEESFDFYTLKKAGPKNLQITVEATGNVEAISAVEIKSKASGEVLFLGAEVGDLVQKGEVLAEIDQRTPQNTLSQAKADLQVAKVRLQNATSQLQRGNELYEGENISDKDFEEIQEMHASAQASLVRAQVFLENAKIALDDTTVKSPITGTVIQRSIEIGNVITSPTASVSGGTLLMRMADLNKVRVRAYIDEVDIGKISIDQEVLLKVSAFRDKQFKGVVSKIAPLGIDVQNVTIFPILIDIDNKDNLLLLEMNTEVEIEILNKKVSLAIPTGSLQTRKSIKSLSEYIGIDDEDLNEFLSTKDKQEGFTKYIVVKSSEEGPKLEWVTVGKTDFKYTEILEGVRKGEEIYVLPTASLIKNQAEFRKRLRSNMRR